MMPAQTGSFCDKNFLGEATKSASSVIPVTFDFTQWLAGLNALLPTPELIVSANFNVSTNLGGLSIGAQSLTQGIATAQLSGGNAGYGEVGNVSCEVVTSSGYRDIFFYIVKID